jgi:hypothetical protein
MRKHKPKIDKKKQNYSLKNLILKGFFSQRGERQTHDATIIDLNLSNL